MSDKFSMKLLNKECGMNFDTQKEFDTLDTCWNRLINNS